MSTVDPVRFGRTAVAGAAEDPVMLRSRREQIGRLAEKVRAACELSTPVDVREAVRRLGGELVEEAGPEREARIEKHGDGFRIILGTEYAESRKKFSVAHELGHLFLHMGYLIDPEKWQAAGTYDDSVYYRYGYTAEEYEAHEFAAAFLMPAAEFAAVANGTLAGDSYRIAPIAQHFGVSEEAAVNRGRWLGLFSWG